MVDLGPFTEPVRFAWDEADKLEAALESAADRLEAQIGGRARDGERALDDWRGNYAKLFREQHMHITITDAKAIAAALRKCAAMVRQLRELAEEEKERRRIALEWHNKHEAWERDQADDDALDNLGDLLGGSDEPKPPDVPEIKPKELVATSPPSCGERR